jgi:hypothetical protein
MMFLSFRVVNGGCTRRQVACAVAVASMLLVAGCGSARHTTNAIDSGPSAAQPAATAAAPAQPAATAAAPAQLTFSLPLTSAKGYHGTLTFDSPPPELTPGTPGRVGVAALNGASGTVSNETTGAEPPYLASDRGGNTVGMYVFLAWKMPADLAQDADIPAQFTNNCQSNCETKGTYLLERAALEPAGGTTVQVVSGQPVALMPVAFTGMSTAALGDRQGTAFSFGAATTPPDFPEADRSTLTRLLTGPPDTVYIEGGYVSGFTFGAADADQMQEACRITPPGQYSGAPFSIQGVIDGHTGQSLQWPASHALAGQPCNSTYASP